MDSTIALVDSVPAAPDLIPKWATENYQGAAEDFSEWMLKVQYQSLLSGGSKQTTRERMAQALANSLKATFNLQEVVERAKVLQLWRAQKTGWYQLLPQKYETAFVFLQELMNEASTSETVDLTFMIEDLLPACEFLGIDAETIVCFPAYYSKARAAVPALRDAWRAMDSKYRIKLSVTQSKDGSYQWRCGGLGSDGFKTKLEALDNYKANIYTILTEDDRTEFANMLYRVIQLIPQEQSVDEFKAEILEIRGKEKPVKELATSMLVILPDGKELYIVRSPNSSITKRVEHQLEKLLVGPASIRDGSYLSKEVREWYDLSIDLKTYSFDVGRKGFVKDVSGVILPDPDGIYNLFRNEIAKNLPVIEQVFRRGVSAWDISVYPLVATGSEFYKLVCDRFKISFKDKSDDIVFAMEILPQALHEMYAEQFEKAIQDTLPMNMDGELNIGLIPETYQWGIYVTISNLSRDGT